MFRWLSFGLFLFLSANDGSFVVAKPTSLIDDITGLFFGKKCMGELGCFSNASPYFDITERPLSLLPDDRELIGTAFRFYTSLQRNLATNVTNKNVTLPIIKMTGFQASQRTIFLVHGYMAHLAPTWLEPLKDAILEVENCNVIIVDWANGDGPLYEQAVANTRVVGAEIAVMITTLQKYFGIGSEDIYIIGHSLGAHIAGYAGKRIPNLGRITGLDPAGPYFENVDSSIRLNSTDALLVDVIHTNAATNRFQGFGTTESIGDMDFYVNEGSQQPGCPNMGLAILDFLMHPNLHGPEVVELMCAHHRAIQLMMSSLTSKDCQLLGAACDSWSHLLDGHCGTCDKNVKLQRNPDCTEMGYRADHYKRNGQHLDLYVKTTDKEPYCIS